MYKIKKIYYYIYYILYKNAEKSPTLFSYNFVASISLDFLGLIFCFSFIYYFDLNLRKELYLLIMLMIVIFNYFVFEHNSSYKKYISEFDELPKEKNNKFKLIVWIGIILVIANIIYSVYYMDQRAKRDQIGPYAPEIVAKENREDSLQKVQQIEKLKKIYGEDKR
ncbi:hypothetical protein MP477_03755 [Chryseobacterium sp. WG23]|uniref:hypothetical protein n=1 Tax=Chryseobacterium sp. WG23 TaxID=2926910 RepID=UPI0006468DDD|nr:hypothetical protein [Chryseobacterium sp. WG23]MCQ9634066.1 hypothetical protein [Chryseobacterium sp. WG23]